MDYGRRSAYTASDPSRKFVIAVVVVLLIIIIVVIVLALLYRSSTAAGASVASCPTMTPPQGLTAVPLNTNTIQTQWTAVPGAVKYKVYVGTVSQFSPSNAISSSVTALTSFNIPGLIVGRTYFIIVTAINACGSEGSLSAQASADLGFPAKFNIVSRSQPTLAMTIDPTFTEIILDPVCSNVGSDNLCVWSYDESTSELHPEVSSVNCMATFAPSVDNTVKYDTCNDINFTNAVNFREWQYTSTNGSLCHPPLNGVTNCVKVNGSISTGVNLIMTPYDGTAGMQWNIVQA